MNAIQASRPGSLFDTAARFSESEKFLTCFFAATRDAESWQQAQADPQGYLRGVGIPLPKGLKIGFFEKPNLQMPGPDYESFSVRLFNCRTLWLPKSDHKGYEQVQICFGFEITGHNPGPRA